MLHRIVAAANPAGWKIIMLSIIVYGRNDGHGYNLHKRAAISINGMAEMLDQPGDEILYVDYNTPDDIPTFLEAIADTLTERAKRFVRVLRVRPSLHARVAGRTHLVAVEPQARNVAIRRSNPQNRWVLSTNTDMVFIPRETGASLSSTVGKLPDGFYHLPRFEIPEGLWEGMVRSDGPAIIRDIAHWSRRFHLDDVVYGGKHIIFDGPGDFQLFLREDLFRIDAFDEEMILGWHVDSNIAKRMTALRGEILSAGHVMKGYHCDHTKLASIYHRRDRVENDSVRFVDKILRPDLPGQRNNWGFADADIPLMRLENGVHARYQRGITKAIKKSATIDTYVSRYNLEGFDDLSYEVDHMLPFLADALSTLPDDAVIGYAGCRPDCFEAMLEALDAAGFAGRVLITHEFSWLPDNHRLVQRVEQSELIAVHNAFVVELGLVAEADAGLRQVRLAVLFEKAALEELAAQAMRAAPPRKFIGVNVVNNQFERLFNQYVRMTMTPFSSRVRHGFVGELAEEVTVRRSGVTDLRHELAVALGRRVAISVAELRSLIDLVKPLKVASAQASAWSAAAGMASILCVMLGMRLGQEMAGLDPARAANISERLAAASPRARLAKQVAPLNVIPSDQHLPSSRLASPSDWDDVDFGRMAMRYFNGTEALESLRRKIWTWERTALLHQMDSQLGLSKEPSILVMAHHPECLAVFADQSGAQVTAMDPLHVVDEFAPDNDWRSQLPHWAGRAPRGVEWLNGAQDIQQQFDGVVLMQNGLFIRGLQGLPRLLRGLSSALRPGGYAFITCQARVDGTTDEVSVPRGYFAGERFRDAWLEMLGFEMLDGPVAQIDPAALERHWPEDSFSDRVPSFVFGENGALATNLLMTFRKERDVSRRDIARFSNWWTNNLQSEQPSRIRKLPQPTEVRAA